MMTKEDYAAKIPDREEREEAARLFEALCVAEAAEREYREDPVPRTPEAEEALNKLYADYSQKHHDLQEWYYAEQRRIALETANPHEAAVEAASAAYDAHPGGAILDDGDDKAARCALSGVPLYDEDCTIEVGSKTVLASLVLSPEQIAALTAEDDGDAELEDAA